MCRMDFGRSARSLPEGRSLALRELKRAKQQARGRAVLASCGPVAEPAAERSKATCGGEGGMTAGLRPTLPTAVGLPLVGGSNPRNLDSLVRLS